MHEIRDNLCCCCVCPQACREPPDSLWAEQLCPFCSLRLAPALKSTLAVWDVFCSPLPSLKIHFAHPQDGIPSACAHIHRSAVLCSLQGGIYLICLKLTNPPVLRNKTNLRRGKVPSSEMIRCYNAVSFEPNSVGQAAIDVVPIVT